jgi:Trypsin-co-occurring domain 2
MEPIGLSDAIQAIRAELSESIRAGVGEDLRFRVGEVRLEFQVGVERTAGGQGGIKFWVISIGAEASRTTTGTHVVRVPLQPLDDRGEPILTGSEVSQLPE